MSVSSVIDILLVAGLIYGVLRLIRGTRAALMLLGLAGLALAMEFVRIGQLPTVNWVITKLLPYAGFTLIVLFQAEIRQALSRLGGILVLSRGNSAVADAYDDIVMAAHQFARNRPRPFRRESARTPQPPSAYLRRAGSATDTGAGRRWLRRPEPQRVADSPGTTA
jgi:hypothetical protein